MQFDQLKRRQFITLPGGAAAAWPLAVRAQQGERVRRIGVLMNLAPNDTEGQARLAAFHQVLQQSGWTVGTNVQIDYRWGARSTESEAVEAKQLTFDEARRIAANIARLPELLRE